ncbi:MAG: cytochrome P450 [Streptosporangiales bacterium]|nr:cytochrome P450 [Streptosporangiales bacterium]
MTETAATPEFNPFAPGFAEDPYPQYAALRDGAPLARTAIGTSMLSRYEDVTALLRGGYSVDQRNLAPGGALDTFQKQMYGDRGLRRNHSPSMLDLDAPDHTRLRKLVAKAFTPRAIDALRPRITAVVDDLLDAIVPGEPFDLVEALAFPLPFTVIAEMLGTPPADHERIRELSGTLVRQLEPVPSPEVASAILEAEQAINALGAEMVAWKRQNPADDMLTALIQAEEDGDRLTDTELVSQTLLLYIAGHETTVNLISGGAYNLLRFPDQLAVLREDPSLIPNAVEEMLRFDSPVQQSRRITTGPATIRGTEIGAGEFISVSLASANRDERFWGPDANEFKVERENARQHVSFGAGPHHCLGAYLARLEARVAFERLLARFGTLELAGDVTWNGRINLRGPARLPVLAR